MSICVRVTWENDLSELLHASISSWLLCGMTQEVRNYIFCVPNVYLVAALKN